MEITKEMILVQQAHVAAVRMCMKSPWFARNCEGCPLHLSNHGGCVMQKSDPEAVKVLIDWYKPTHKKQTCREWLEKRLTKKEAAVIVGECCPVDLFNDHDDICCKVENNCRYADRTECWNQPVPEGYRDDK